MNRKATYTVDVRGTISPFSLLKVSLVFQQMKPSEIVEVLGCDSEMQQDLLRLLPNASFEVLDGKENQADTSVSIVRCCKIQL